MRGNLLLDPRVDEQAVKNAKHDDQPKAVRLAYPRQGIWSGNNQLGVELPFELDADRMQTIFKLDEWGFPEVWTLSLSIALPKDLVVGQIFDVIGEISFGAGGIVQTFEVDWVEGTIFSLPMNAINVWARWSDLATIQGVPPPPGIRISVIAARGAIRHARATRTGYFGALGPGATFENPFVAPPIFPAIPTFARSVIVTPGSAASAAVLYAPTTELRFLTNDNTAVPNIIQSVPGTFLGPTASFKVPIPANARYYTIFNGGGAPIPAGPAGNAGSTIWSLFDE